MQKLAAMLVVVMAAIPFLFFVIVLSPLLGWLEGYVIAWVCPSIVCEGFATLGLSVTPEKIPPLAAVLAFVGSFFKYSGKREAKTVEVNVDQRKVTK